MTNASEKQVQFLTSLINQRRHIVETYRTYWLTQTTPVAVKNVAQADAYIGLLDSLDLAGLTTNEASVAISYLKTPAASIWTALINASKQSPVPSAALTVAMDYERANRQAVRAMNIDTATGMLRHLKLI
jgi:hypothetical protein